MADPRWPGRSAQRTEIDVDGDGFDLGSPEGFVLFAGSGLLDDPVECATCGRPLGDDPEDDPEGDAGLPICGECDRSRNFVARAEQGLYDDR